MYLFLCVRERKRKKEEKGLTEGGFTGKKVTKFVFCTDLFHGTFSLMNEAKGNVSVLNSFSTHFL